MRRTTLSFAAAVSIFCYVAPLVAAAPPAITCDGGFKSVVGSDGTLTYGADGDISKELNLIVIWRSIDPTRLLVGLRPKAGFQPFSTCRRITFLGSASPLPWDDIELSKDAALAGFIPFGASSFSGTKFGVDICGNRFGAGTTLGCGIHQMAEAIAKRPAAPAPPQVSEFSSSPPALDEGEPFGVALAGGSRVSDVKNIAVKWGMLLPAVRAKTAPDEGDILSMLFCQPDDGGASETCTWAKEGRGHWHADFGLSRIESENPVLRFTKDGLFYAYSVEIDPGSFEKIYSILSKRLGLPISNQSSTVQNRMGAIFDQHMVAWQTAHVRVELTKRGSNLLKGSLAGVYLPIAAAIPPPPEGKAPM